jgi:3-polyprenyl-4-hydroxybenzoate decarboxylase
MFIKGPLDVLDHSSDRFSFGGKAGLDATIKLPEERTAEYNNKTILRTFSDYIKEQLNNNQLITEYNTALLDQNIPILIISVDRGYDKDVIEKNYEYLTTLDPEGLVEFIIAVD